MTDAEVSGWVKRRPTVNVVLCLPLPQRQYWWLLGRGQRVWFRLLEADADMVGRVEGCLIW